jgi:hypothetical protein
MTRNGDWKVTRYSKDGEKLQDIQRDEERRALYWNITYLTENINGDICVTDSCRQEVVVGTEYGQYRFSYSGQRSLDEFVPYGICTDDLGHIIVCNHPLTVFKDNVHLLSKDGQFLMFINTSDQHEPETSLK